MSPRAHLTPLSRLDLLAARLRERELMHQEQDKRNEQQSNTLPPSSGAHKEN